MSQETHGQESMPAYSMNMHVTVSIYPACAAVFIALFFFLIALSH